jgi:hypothetical protein
MKPLPGPDFDKNKYELIQDEDGECLLPINPGDEAFEKPKNSFLGDKGWKWINDLVTKKKKMNNPAGTQPPLTQEQKDLQDAFASFFNAGGDTPKSKGPPPKPVVYDDMGESTKIAEKYPMFGFASLLDEILDEFGGVTEIMSCNWNNITDEGTVTCLMKDWRVFRYNLKANEFATLSYDDRKSKINRECLVFEDMDDFGHWEELGGVAEENDKNALVKKKKEEDMTNYGEKMNDALGDFFNGGVEAMQKMMSKNDGKSKSSYLDSEA